MADENTLDLILREARSHGSFHGRAVDPALLRKAHEIMKWGPTTANSQPARIFYLASRESREKLRPALADRGQLRVGRVAERAHHAGDVLERRLHGPPLRQRSRGLAFEIENHELPFVPQHLAEVEVAMHARRHQLRRQGACQRKRRSRSRA